MTHVLSVSLTFLSGKCVQQAQVESTKACQDLFQSGRRSQNTQPENEKKDVKLSIIVYKYMYCTCSGRNKRHRHKLTMRK